MVQKAVRRMKARRQATKLVHSILGPMFYDGKIPCCRSEESLTRMLADRVIYDPPQMQLVEAVAARTESYAQHVAWEAMLCECIQILAHDKHKMIGHLSMVEPGDSLGSDTWAEVRSNLSAEFYHHEHRWHLSYHSTKRKWEDYC